MSYAGIAIDFTAGHDNEMERELTNVRNFRNYSTETNTPAIVLGLSRQYEMESL